MSKPKDTTSIKYLLTINNPLKKRALTRMDEPEDVMTNDSHLDNKSDSGTEHHANDESDGDSVNDTDGTSDSISTITYDPETIKLIIEAMSDVEYYCFMEEVGGEQNTHHVHIYIHFRQGKKKRFSYIKRRFPHARIDKCRATAQQNRDYIRKEGEKWENSKKKNTSIPGTFFEAGTLPVNEQGKRTDLEYLYDLIQEGYTDYEILSEVPESMKFLSHIERTRQILVAQDMEGKERDLLVIYVTGQTNSGKSYKLVQDNGTSLFRSTNKKNPFDGFVPYKHSALAFEEFDESIKLTDMLNYLDSYGLALPARYSDKIATFETVYIVSNRSLELLYSDERYFNRSTYEAFISRIDKVRYHYIDRTFEEFLTLDYLQNKRYRECFAKDEIIYRSLTPKQKADRLKRRKKEITIESTVDMSKYGYEPPTPTTVVEPPAGIPQIYGEIPTIFDNPATPPETVIELNWIPKHSKEDGSGHLSIKYDEENL